MENYSNDRCFKVTCRTNYVGTEVVRYLTYPKKVIEAYGESFQEIILDNADCIALINARMHGFHREAYECLLERLSLDENQVDKDEIISQNKDTYYEIHQLTIQDNAHVEVQEVINWKEICEFFQDKEVFTKKEVLKDYCGDN